MCNNCLKKDYIDIYAKTKNFDEIQANYNKALSDIAECKQMFTQATEMLKEHKLEYVALNEKMNALFEKFNQLSNNEADKLATKQEILQEITQHNNSNDEHILQLIREERLREKKRLNLCIRGFPRSETVDDLEAFRLLCCNQLNLSRNEALKISSCRRITSHKPLMIATVENFDTKKLILSNAYKLKNFKSDLNSPIFIAPDLTKAEQAKQIDLRKELMARRQAGQNVYIKKNTIISRPTIPTGPVTRSRTAHQQQLDASIICPPVAHAPPSSPCRSPASSTSSSSSNTSSPPPASAV